MNCSWVTARMAGTESTANTTSVVSIMISDREQRRGQPLAGLPREQLLAVVLGGGRDRRGGRAAAARFVLRVDLGLVVTHDLPRRVEQERAEDVEDASKRSISATPAKMKIGPQHERAEDAPEQDPELVRPGHGEEREDHRPDEDVVDREALLDQVAGEVLAGRPGARRPRDDEREARPIAIQTATRSPPP